MIWQPPRDLAAPKEPGSFSGIWKYNCRVVFSLLPNRKTSPFSSLYITQNYNIFSSERVALPLLPRSFLLFKKLYLPQFTLCFHHHLIVEQLLFCVYIVYCRAHFSWYSYTTRRPYKHNPLQVGSSYAYFVVWNHFHQSQYRSTAWVQHGHRTDNWDSVSVWFSCWGLFMVFELSFVIFQLPTQLWVIYYPANYGLPTHNFYCFVSLVYPIYILTF